MHLVSSLLPVWYSCVSERFCRSAVLLWIANVFRNGHFLNTTLVYNNRWALNRRSKDTMETLRTFLRSYCRHLNTFKLFKPLFFQGLGQPYIWKTIHRQTVVQPKTIIYSEKLNQKNLDQSHFTNYRQCRKLQSLQVRNLVSCHLPSCH